MNKTVYFLGAGFSVPAGAPRQSEIMEIILKGLNKGNNQDSYEAGRLIIFLTETIGYRTEDLLRINLEDILTPIDRCLIDNMAFRNIAVDKLADMRESIYYLISRAIKIGLDQSNSNADYIKHFAKYLVGKASTRANFEYKKMKDPVSVISTNWDILLDNEIKRELESFGILPSSDNPKGVVDYCCHISSFISDKSIKPGLEVLGGGGFNVKLLKIHGSMNWLNCPRCQRLYVDFYEKICLRQYLDKSQCSHCNRNFGESESHILRSNLIMPTYLKSLSNPQYRLIWQNAGIELSEATEIIFAGYSLPTADFEIRQLLSRMVRKEARIKLVTRGSREDSESKKQLKDYEMFFGREVEPIFGGARDYFNSLTF